MPDLPGGPTDPEVQDARNELYVAASPRQPEHTTAELLDVIKSALAKLDSYIARTSA